MARPTFLLAEPEPEQALSVRKLVLETAKYNVITAHSGAELSELFQQFPNVNAVIVHSHISDRSCDEMLGEIKGRDRTVTTFLLSAHLGAKCETADHILSSHQPEELLQLLRSLFGDPAATNRADAARS
jgi:response regulator RpfG family c-di-GMP phosphodiesterase